MDATSEIPLVQRLEDRTIVQQTHDLKPYGAGAPQILHKVLLEYGAPLHTVDDCTELLRNSRSLYEKLVEAHNTGRYQDLVDAALSRSSPISSSVTGTTSTSATNGLSANAHELIQNFLPAMRSFVSPSWNWETWKPTPSDHATSEEHEICSWLSELKIPLLNGTPNLLLHRLGSLQDDPCMKARLEKVFVRAVATFLVNTSGSGKTRHVLEGLCREWGFYFVSTTETEDFGSTDIMNCIMSRLLANPNFTECLPSPDFHYQLADNCRIADECFSQVFLARIIIFRVFLDSIIESGRLITEEDKHRWLLLQIRPAILTPSSDIFDELAQVISQDGLSAAVCKERINSLLWEQRVLLAKHSTTTRSTKSQKLYCVLDEAQRAASQLTSAFRSSKDPSVSRPVLRELIVFLKYLMTKRIDVTIAGTGIDEALVEETLKSIINKSKNFTWTTQTGSFNKEHSRELQATYICRYIPPTILQTASGQRLIERIHHWLEGRFRFTAAFLVNLLQSDLKNPHQFLDDWVEYHTTFRPTDALDLTSPHRVYDNFSTPPLHEQLQFERFFAKQGAISLLNNAVYDSLLRGKIFLNIEGQDHSLVETGFGHYRDAPDRRTEMLAVSVLAGNDPARKAMSSRNIKQLPRTCCVSEPLIILAATAYMNKFGPFENLWQYVTRSVDKLKGSEHNGFETYIAFMIAHAFATPTKLEDVFEFPDAQVPKWADQEARLVALSRDSQSSRLSAHEFDWPGAAVSSSRFGMELSELHTVEWLNHRHHHKPPFAFPDNNMGPDLLFVLQLKDKTFIWVSIQAKYHQNPIYGQNLVKAIRTTDPNKYWKDNTNAPYAPDKYPTLIEDTLKGLKALPGPEDMGTDYPLLRVIAVTARSKIGMDEVEKISRRDPHDKQPICLLNWQYLIGRFNHEYIITNVLLFRKRKEHGGAGSDLEEGGGSHSDMEEAPPPAKKSRTESTKRHTSRTKQKNISKAGTEKLPVAGPSRSGRGAPAAEHPSAWRATPTRRHRHSTQALGAGASSQRGSKERAGMDIYGRHRSPSSASAISYRSTPSGLTYSPGLAGTPTPVWLSHDMHSLRMWTRTPSPARHEPHSNQPPGRQSINAPSRGGSASASIEQPTKDYESGFPNPPALLASLYFPGTLPTHGAPRHQHQFRIPTSPMRPEPYPSIQKDRPGDSDAGTSRRFGAIGRERRSQQ